MKPHPDLSPKAPAPAACVVPDKLRPGDEIRVLALSRSLGGLKRFPGVSDADIEFARQRLEALGLRVSFGRHVLESDAHLTASVEARLEDLHNGLIDPAVKGLLAVTGGMGAIQLLQRLDFSLFVSHPKILCGYSDVGFLCNAICRQTGVITYYGPNFSTFMMRHGGDYTWRHFQKCVFESQSFDAVPAAAWGEDNWLADQERRQCLPSTGWWGLTPGSAEGTVIGGSLFSLNLLQGSACFPSLNEAILFLEHPSEGKGTLMNLDMGLRALALQPEFCHVRGLVIGRYASSAGIERAGMTALIQAIAELRDIPVIANCDFGHTTPMLTLPIGGRCRIAVSGGEGTITFTTH